MAIANATPDKKKSASSNTVKLTIFTAYRRPAWVAVRDKKDEPAFLYGASEYRLDKINGQLLLTFDNVPLGSKQAPPSPGFTALYGHRDSLDEIARRRREARNHELEFKQADVNVYVGEILPGILDHDSLKLVKFANWRRINAQLQRDIYDFFVTKIQAEGGEVDEDMNRTRVIARRPDLFGSLLSEDRRFKRLDVFVVPIDDNELSPDNPSDPRRIRHVAYVRPGARILSIDQSHDGDLLQLPEGFKVKPLTDADVAAAEEKAASKPKGGVRESAHVG